MRLIFTILLLFVFIPFFAQNTVGLINHTTASYNAYTLFSPLNSENTYLINNCGEVVNEWITDSEPHYTSYLMDNGNLVRFGPNINSNAEFLEIRDWNNNLVWKWTPNFGGEFIHSDLAILPNGNFLVIVEEYIPFTEWVSEGGNFSGSNIAKMENIYEIEPIGTNAANIVWQWRVMDHIIQDNNSLAPNYGVVANHPELLDMNFTNSVNQFTSWMHVNAVDYNADLDLIMISCFSCSEIFIIDHSTTTAEAETSFGGSYGKGGDFLYRYGNPANYDNGTAADRVFFGQHNASWVADGLPYAGKITVHENGNNRPLQFGQNPYSRIVLMELPLIENVGFEMDATTNTFLPNSFNFTWQGAVNGTTYYSPFYSGVNVQPNGNFVVCEGVSGRMFEINAEDSSVVWQYNNPDVGFILNQGQSSNNGDSYRAERYFEDFVGFVGKDLTPTSILENTNTASTNCTLNVNACPKKIVYIYNVPTGNYEASETIESTGKVKNVSNVIFKAGNYVALKAGFAVENNADFLAEIEVCY